MSHYIFIDIDTTLNEIREIVDQYDSGEYDENNMKRLKHQLQKKLKDVYRHCESYEFETLYQNLGCDEVDEMYRVDYPEDVDNGVFYLELPRMILKFDLSQYYACQ